MSKDMRIRSTNKGLTVKINLWSMEKYLDRLDSEKAKGWITGQVSNPQTKAISKFKNAEQLIAILAEWNSKKFQMLMSARKKLN
jgi:hypothetical protein